MKRFVPIMLLASVLACDDEPQIEPEPEVEEPATAPYSIHEWGFIGMHFTDTEADSRHVGAGPGRFPPPAIGLEGLGTHGLGLRGTGLRGGKPILYVHLAEGVDEARFEASVALPRGRFVEAMPVVSREGNTIAWQVEARRGSCSARERYPTIDSPSCQHLSDGFCEAAELGAYETDDAACLKVDGEDWNHLFYRADVEGPVPVGFTDESGLMMRTTAILPGKMIRIRRSADRSETRVQVFDAPAPGNGIRVPWEPSAPAEEGVSALRSMLLELGMTESETGAFMRAWEVNLFGAQGDAPAAEAVQRGHAPAGLAPVSEALVYFLPKGNADALIRLELDPPPTEIRRAMLVRVDLRSRSEGTIGLGNLGTIGGSGMGLGLGYGYGGSMRVLARGPRVRTHAPEVTGGLSPEIVRRIIRRHINEVRACAESAQAPIDGEIELSWRVGRDGRVANVQVGEDELGNAQVTRCVRDAVRRWEFPEPEAEVSVRQRFVLIPPEE